MIRSNISSIQENRRKMWNLWNKVFRNIPLVALTVFRSSVCPYTTKRTKKARRCPNTFWQMKCCVQVRNLRKLHASRAAGGLASRWGCCGSTLWGQHGSGCLVEVQQLLQEQDGLQERSVKVSSASAYWLNAVGRSQGDHLDPQRRTNSGVLVGRCWLWSAERANKCAT